MSVNEWRRSNFHVEIFVLRRHTVCLQRVAVSGRRWGAKMDTSGRWGRVIAGGGSGADGFDWRGRNRGASIGAGLERALCWRCRCRGDASGTVGASFFSLSSGTTTDHSFSVVIVFDRRWSGFGAHLIGVDSLAASSSCAGLRYGNVRRVQNTGAGDGPASSWFDVGADDHFCV